MPCLVSYTYSRYLHAICIAIYSTDRVSPVRYQTCLGLPILRDKNRSAENSRSETLARVQRDLVEFE